MAWTGSARHSRHSGRRQPAPRPRPRNPRYLRPAKAPQPARILFASENSERRGLGAALPNGGLTLYEPTSSGDQLVAETRLRDFAKGEEVELALAPSAQVFAGCARRRQRAGRGGQALGDALGRGEQRQSGAGDGALPPRLERRVATVGRARGADQGRAMDRRAALAGQQPQAVHLEGAPHAGLNSQKARLAGLFTRRHEEGPCAAGNLFRAERAEEAEAAEKSQSLCDLLFPASSAQSTFLLAAAPLAEPLRGLRVFV